MKTPLSTAARRAAAGLSLLAALAHPAAADTTIGSLVNGAQANNEVSTGNYISQTFTAPTDAYLQTFVMQAMPGNSLTFSLYAYNPGTRAATGGVLFTEGPVAGVTVPGPYGSPAVQYTYQTGGLQLTSGASYLASFQGTGSINAPFFFSYPATTDAYTGGFFSVNAPTDRHSDPFGSLAPSDLAFSATFTSGPVAARGSAAPVPEPSTVAPFTLAGLGLLGLTVRARRRTPAALSAEEIPAACQ